MRLENIIRKFISQLMIDGHSNTVDFREQVLGGIVGFSIGDALGVPFEFKSREEVVSFSKMIGYGTHNQPPGSWSDDSSLTFCLVENLMNGYDKVQLQNLFCEWYYYGYWTHDKKLPFDIGQSTFKALSTIKSGVFKPESGESGGQAENSNGNGSLMRVLPLSYYLLNEVEDVKFPLIEEVSGITHAHIRSKIACSIYVEMAIQLLRKQSPEVAYKNMQKVITSYYTQIGYEKELSVFKRILEADISIIPEEGINSSGYVVDSVEACLWSFLNGHSYEESVSMAIQLGEDTDTIGALTGGLSGIHYGYSKLPSKWIKKIARKEDVVKLSDEFYIYLSRRIGENKK